MSVGFKIEGLEAIEEWAASEYEMHLEEVQQEIVSAFGEKKKAEDNSDAEPGDL